MLKGFIKRSDFIGITKSIVQFFDARPKNELNRNTNGQKNLGGPTQVISSAIGLFVLSQLVAIFIIELILGFGKSWASFEHSIVAQFGYVAIAEGLALALTLRLVKFKKLTPNFIGLGRRPNLNDLRKAALGFLAFYGLTIILSIIVNILAPSVNNQSQDLGFNSLNGATDSILAFIALVILPPFGEEPLVRGYLYSGLRARWNFVPAMIVTSLLIGLAQLEFAGPLVWGAGLKTFVLTLVIV